VLTAAAALLVAYLPGAVFFRLPVASRARRAALDADERLFWAVILSAAWSCGLTLALAAVGQYRFTTLLWINGGLAVAMALAARLDLRLAGAPGPRAAALVPAAIVAAGLWLYFPASEYVMGGKDPGTYINEGIQIAQRGRLLVQDPTVAGLPPQARDLFVPSHSNDFYYGLRFMGFFVMDPGEGTVLGQFPHFYPASIAIGYGLNGLTGAREVVGAWAILGLLAVFFTAARLFGRLAAAGAAALLAINVVQVWFARYPNAEVVMQALVFAAVLALARAAVDGDRFFAPVAGALLGAMLFLRYDAVLAIGACGAAAVLLWMTGRGRTALWPFWSSLIAGVMLGLWYLRDVMGPYSEYPLRFTREATSWPVAAAAAGCLGFAVWCRRRPRVSAAVSSATPLAWAGVLAAGFAYAYFFRQPAGTLAPHDAMALRVYAWYVLPAGLFAAVAGLVPGARRFWRDPAFFLTAGVFALFFFYKIRIVPDHFWMTRRFLPVILPATLILVAALATWMVEPGGLSALLRRKRAERPDDRPGRARAFLHGALGLALLAPLGWAYSQRSRPLLSHVEYAGLIPRLERLAGGFGENDLVLVESRNASDLHVLALPLAYIYARNVLVLDTPRPDPPAFASFLDWAEDRYDRVFFVGGGGTELLSRRIGVEPVAGDRFQVPEYDSPQNAYPAGVRHKEFDYSLYRFVAPLQADGRFVLDLGGTDDLMVVRFHAKERHQSGFTFRWSQDTSFISIVGMRPDASRITISMGDGGRPAQASPAIVTVSFDGRLLARQPVSRDVQPYPFTLPPDVVAAAAARDAPARLQLTTSTWNPRGLLGVPDDRDLGVMVTRVEVQ
jgi:hypothetical protein